MKVYTFTFNMYQENTYVLAAESGECVIIDPGCYNPVERTELKDFIEKENLVPVYLLNTHGHIDHMLGNAFVKSTWDVPFLTHKIVDEVELPSVPDYGHMMGLNVDPSPRADQLLQEGDTVAFGEVRLDVIFTPGHSPGHISFFHRESKQLFAGDVLFAGSIGRVDLPGGDYDTLMEVILNKILPLGDDITVYPGHGPSTITGVEQQRNPFILEYNQHLKNQSS